MDTIRVMTAAFAAEDKLLAARLLANDAFNVVASLRPDSDGLRKAGTCQADVLALCTTKTPEAEFDFAERLYMTRGDLAIVLLCSDTTPAVIHSAMLAGISRVIDVNMGADAVKTEVFAAASREKNRQSIQHSVSTYSSKIIQFFCPKGGTGKTMLAVNLAVALAALGKKVALIDLNLQFGDVGIFLDIDKGDTIADLVEENNFELKTLKSYMVRHYSGVHVLLASNAPEYAELIKPPHIESILATLRSEFDYIVLDMTPNFSDCAIAALEQSDTVFFVVTQEISALHNAKRSLKVIEALNLMDKVQLAINKDGISTISVKDVEGILDRKAVLIVPNDQKTAVRAINRGVPVVLGDKRSAIAQAILEFAKKLVRET
ncbi:MAG: AAA family ATPase [Clostridia bacterium]